MPPELLAFQRELAGALDGPASGAMAVYHNTVVHGAVEALRANYPVVEQLVGTEMFACAAADYAAQRPPNSPVLALYGARFADWLETQAWTDDIPYLADVARIERLRIEALMAADAPVLRGSDAARWEMSQARLHPAVRFGWFRTPSMTIWTAHQQGVDDELAIDWRAEGALFTRPGAFDLRGAPIDAAGHRFLSGLRIRESVSSAMRTVMRLYPATDPELLFASLVTAGAFAAPPLERPLQ